MLQQYLNNQAMHKHRFFLIILISGMIMIPGVLNISAQKNPPGKSEGKIRVASCQFPVSADMKENYMYIEAQVTEAKLKKADVVHFSECALSGYPGTDMMSLEKFDWNELHRLTDSVMSLAKELNIWVILGSLQKLGGNNKPHNCLYVINPEGGITDRYDKRFCTGSDLEYCSPGDHFVTFELKGVKCGLLICYDVRFPELYREYRKLGCDMIFQSFYNARQGKGSIHPIIMPVSAQAHAATNYFYMSLTNSSATESWPCHFITPDGLIQNKLAANVPGVLISDVDKSEQYYDASREYRQDAMSGKLNSGSTIKDPESSDRTSIH
jgi:predicted amidohydrolase